MRRIRRSSVVTTVISIALCACAAENGRSSEEPYCQQNLHPLGDTCAVELVSCQPRSLCSLTIVCHRAIDGKRTCQCDSDGDDCSSFEMVQVDADFCDLVEKGDQDGIRGVVEGLGCWGETPK